MAAPNTDRTKSSATKVGRKVEIPESERRLYRPSRESHISRGRRRGIFALSMIVVIVVVLSFTVYVLLTKEEGAKTPTEAFLTMVDAINDEDAEALVMCSVIRFADETTMQHEITELEVVWAESGGYTIVVNSYQILTGSESAYVQESLDELRDYTEEVYSVDVVDCCAFLVNCSVYKGNEGWVEEIPFPFVKIGSEWYLAFFPFPEGSSIIVNP